MTRNFFLYLSQQQRLRRWMETSPMARKLTSRFVAGETLDDELKVSAELQGAGNLTALDHLGENVTSLEEAAAVGRGVLQALGPNRRARLAGHGLAQGHAVRHGCFGDRLL